MITDLTGRRLLLLSRYGRLGASSRYRALQFIPELKRRGLIISVSPMLDDRYLQRQYQGQGVERLALMRAYWTRIHQLVDANEYDLVWIEKEALPFVPGWVEVWLLRGRVPFVLDYDDAVFHNYDRHPNPLIQRLLGRKYDAIMRRASLVVAGNEYIAERARYAGAANVQLLPTVVDLERYRAKVHSPECSSRPRTIGWIGSPSSGKYLESVVDAIRQVAQTLPISLTVVGISERDFSASDLSIRYVPWKEEDEVSTLLDFDLGIMPLPDTPWTRGKCGLKLIQYMASGLPVAASPVGVNADIVDHGENGYLCSTTAEWTNALLVLLSSSDHRNDLGRAGRDKIERLYSLQVAAPKLAELFSTAISTSR